MSAALWIRHAPLRLEVGRNVFKSNHHDRDVVVGVSLRSLVNQLFRRHLRVRDGPYELAGCLVIQNVPYLRFIRRARSETTITFEMLATHPIAG